MAKLKTDLCREEIHLTEIRAASRYLIMAPVSVLSAFLAVIASVLLARCIRWYATHTRQQWRVENKVTESQQIADFSFFHTKTLKDKLKLRAKPNARLFTTFNIQNSFTTDDTDLHNKFVKRANNAINIVHTEDWIKLSGITQNILDLCQKHFRDGLPYIPLASCK